MSIKWQNNWNIEVGEIDNQHRALVEQVSHLLEACKKGDSKQEVSSVLNFLSQYVKEHFRYEEEQHRLYNYPDRDEHARIHNKFTHEVTKLQERFEKEGFSYQFTILLNRKLVDWLIDHIGRVDQKFGDFVKRGA
ncbi:MAG: hemerythrin family protein [Clostridiales bacterium]|nr:hemerythrin family protein [Clostridiales bacterium]